MNEKNYQKTRFLNKYRWAMRVLAAFYLTLGILFFLFAPKIFELLQLLPETFESMPLPTSSLPTVLFCGLALNLAVLSFLSSIYPRSWSFLLVHLTTKLATGGMFFFFFLYSKPYWVYLIGGSIESAIALFILYTMIRYAVMRPYKQAESFDPDLGASIKETYGTIPKNTEDSPDSDFGPTHSKFPVAQNYYSRAESVKSCLKSKFCNDSL